jgi:hypothetical protein
MTLDPNDPYPNDSEAPRGREEVKDWEAGRAVISLRSDFMFLLGNGCRDEALEFMAWANDQFADSVWGKQR